jgi:hypothetical protein
MFSPSGVNASNPRSKRSARSLAALACAMSLSVSSVAQAPAETAAAAAPAATPAAAPTAAIASDPALTLPELNPSDWFDGKAGGTFGGKTVKILPRNKRVAIVGFKVIYVNETFSRARVRASYMPGRDMSGASAAMQVNLRGVDDATLQLLTDQAYARFVAQLRAAGREVLTPADNLWDYAEFESEAGPVDSSFGNIKGRAFTPQGLPLWSQIGEPWGGVKFSQKNTKAMAAVSNKVDAAIAIAPVLVVDFAQMSSSGNRSGLVARTAEVGTTLAISVNRLDTRVVRAEKIKFGGVQKGDDAWLNLKQAIDTDIEFAVLEKTTKDHGKGVGGFLSKAFVGNAKTAFRLAKTTNEEYSKASTAVLERATGTLAKLFAENAPK